MLGNVCPPVCPYVDMSLYNCAFSLHACTSCSLSAILLISISGSLHACYACSDVHGIVCPHLFVDQYVWVPSVVFMLVMRVVLYTV